MKTVWESQPQINSKVFFVHNGMKYFRKKKVVTSLKIFVV